jgi:hypothetical protein
VSEPATPGTAIRATAPNDGDAAVVAWRAACLDPEKIRTICAAPYLNERR